MVFNWCWQCGKAAKQLSHAVHARSWTGESKELRMGSVAMGACLPAASKGTSYIGLKRVQQPSEVFGFARKVS